MTPKDYKVNQRVEVHPAHDMWMRGARFGTVRKIGRKYVHVNLDYRYDRTATMAFLPRDITAIRKDA